MRNATRRGEFWQRVLRVGRPVGARFRDFDKTSAKRERRVAGVVANGEHFVAERRDEKQVHVRENPRHLLADFAAEAVGLNEINGRKKPSLAEKIRPGVVRLHFELIDAVGKRELLEGGGALGEEVEIERAIGPIGQKDFDGAHAELFDGFEGGAVDVGGGRLLHPRGEIADAKALDRGSGIEVKIAGDAGDVAGIRAGDGLEDEDGVLDRKSTRLNSSHMSISYAVFCLKKKRNKV